MSDNLDITREAENQSNPWVPHNEALGEIDARLSETVAITVSNTNARTITDVELDSGIRFTLGNAGTSPSAAVTVSLPASSKRGLTLWINNLAYAATIQKLGGQSITAPIIGSGLWSLIEYDGTNAREIAGSGTGNLRNDTTANLTAGFTSTMYDLGTKSSGTLTPDPADGNEQEVINGGAFTLEPPTTGTGNTAAIILIVTNNGSAGAINTTAFDLVIGAFTTTEFDKFRCVLEYYDGFSLLTVENGVTLESEGVTFADAASTAEVLTGTETVKFVTPDALAALWEKGSDVASATTITFGEGGYFHITGTVTITDVDWATAKNGRWAWVVFDGILTLTHHATTLILPGAANITTAAGDRALFIQDASDNVYCMVYSRADGTAIDGGGSFTAASTTEALTGTNTTKGVTPDALAALWEKGSDVASSGTISFAEGGYFHITGTTTITDIDWATAKNGRWAWVIFDGALTLTHNATTLLLPGGANITTAANDRALFIQDASDNVYCVVYQRANGTAIDGGGSFVAASTTEVLTGTNATKGVTPDALAALWEAGADVSDGATITIGEGGYFNLITSTTAITSFSVTTDKAGRTFRCRFNTARTLTYHATNLIIPGSANITTVAGDLAQFRSDGAGHVTVEWYTRADGTPVIASANMLKSNTSANLTVGYTATGYSAGTKSSGTYTPDPANGALQYAVNGGAHTLAPPSTGGGNAVSLVVQYTNNGSAGAITTSGFTKVSGSFTTTNGDDFMCYMTVINAFSHLSIVALQ